MAVGWKEVAVYDFMPTKEVPVYHTGVVSLRALGLAYRGETPTRAVPLYSATDEVLRPSVLCVHPTSKIWIRYSTPVVCFL